MLLTLRVCVEPPVCVRGANCMCMIFLAPGCGECDFLWKDGDGPMFGSSLFLPFILLSCLVPHGVDQAWRQRSVLSYTLRLLFVEKAGGAYTMVKVKLNVPFRNNSCIWTHIAPEQKRQHVERHNMKMLCKEKFKALCVVWWLINHFRGLDHILCEEYDCCRNCTDTKMLLPNKTLIHHFQINFDRTEKWL